MRLVEFESVDINKLDDYLSKLCSMIKKGQAERPEYYGMVAAGILTPKGRWVAKINYPKGSKRVHAERAAIEEYQKYHGKIPKGSILITTLSPCNEKDDVTAADRVGVSCTDLINQQGFESVYSGYKDPTQDNEHGEYKEVFTKNKQLKNMCVSFADTFLEENLMGFLAKPVKKKTTTSAEEMRKYFEKEKAKEPDKIERGEIDKKAQQVYTKRDENFADGKHPEDKGDSARLGIPKHASISSLRKIAKQGGRKGQLAHWQANMRSGRNK